MEDDEDEWEDEGDDEEEEEEDAEEDDKATEKRLAGRYWKRRFELWRRYNEGILMDEVGWFSVTPENIAARIAERCRCDTVLDAFAGVGGNAIQFALTCGRVIAVDIDLPRLRLAEHNAAVYEVADRIKFVHAEMEAICPVLATDVVFLSPPWGGPEAFNESNGRLKVDLRALGGFDCHELLRLSLQSSSKVAFYLPKSTPPGQIVLLGTCYTQLVEARKFESLKEEATKALMGDGLGDNNSLFSLSEFLPPMSKRADSGDEQAGPKKRETLDCEVERCIGPTGQVRALMVYLGFGFKAKEPDAVMRDVNEWAETAVRVLRALGPTAKVPMVNFGAMLKKEATGKVEGGLSKMLKARTDLFCVEGIGHLMTVRLLDCMFIDGAGGSNSKDGEDFKRWRLDDSADPLPGFFDRPMQHDAFRPQMSCRYFNTKKGCRSFACTFAHITEPGDILKNNLKSLETSSANKALPSMSAPTKATKIPAKISFIPLLPKGKRAEQCLGREWVGMKPLDTQHNPAWDSGFNFKPSRPCRHYRKGLPNSCAHGTSCTFLHDD